MFSPLAFTKTYSMAASAALAITLVPVLMGYFIRGKVLPEHKNPLNRLLTAIYLPVLKGFSDSLKRFFLHRWLYFISAFGPLIKSVANLFHHWMRETSCICQRHILVSL